MVDAAVSTPAKAAKATKTKKPKAKSTHPKVSEMVSASVKALKERGGSSLHAIKKYMAGTYKVDVEKLSPFIRKYLKSAVASGELVQTKGKGANGSFRMGGAAAPAGKDKKKSAAKPKKAAVKAAKPKKAKAATPKKAAKPKASVKKPKKSSPVKKVKPAAKKAVKKPKPVKLVAAKTKKPKATPKKAAAKRGRK